MTPGKLLQIVCFVWMGSELALLILRRSSQSSQNRDSGSVAWLNITIYGSLAVAITIAISGFGQFQYYRVTLAWIGLTLIIAGLGFRWTAILTLKNYFTVNVAIQAGQRIIKSGIFRFIRHPSYSGTMLSFLGLALALGNWISIVAILVPISLAFARRIQIEERALTEAFGSEYSDYCRSTWRIIPWIY